MKVVLTWTAGQDQLILHRELKIRPNNQYQVHPGNVEQTEPKYSDRSMVLPRKRWQKENTGLERGVNFKVNTRPKGYEERSSCQIPQASLPQYTESFSLHHFRTVNTPCHLNRIPVEKTRCPLCEPGKLKNLVSLSVGLKLLGYICILY